MRSFKYHFGVGVLIFAAAVQPPPAVAVTGEPSAPSLVRAVRQSENWIHEVNSLYLRIESKWTRTPEGIAARRSELEKELADKELDPNQWSDLKPISTGTIAFAFDQKRLWEFNYFPGESRHTRIWDGRQKISHEEFFSSGEDSYYIDSTPLDFGPMFAHISWHRSQPHSFWWEPRHVNERMKYYGYPKDFILTGRQHYRGIDCYVLDWKPEEGLYAASDLSKRWYVGVKDKRLYGFATLRSGQLDVRHWTLDYQQVADGCWFPMTQGYELYQLDSRGVPYLRAFQEQKFVEVSIDKGLSDDLFTMEFKEGVQVNDRRSGHLITYIYKAPLIGKALPSLGGIKTDFDPHSMQDNSVLLCFFDFEQRPSRHYVLELAKQAEQLKEKRVTVVAVQATKMDENTLNEWVKKNSVPFPVGIIEGDAEKTRFAWGVKSMPWLILTDREHIVIAEGFAVNDLDEKIPSAHK